MKKFEGLTHYEILEISVNASEFEIRQAYRDALSIYSEDSLITYSLFSEPEREEILKQIENAFFTLIDEGSRADYDKSLLGSGRMDAQTQDKRPKKQPIPIFSSSRNFRADPVLTRIRKRLEVRDVEGLKNQILSKDLISGDDLKHLRKAMGITLEEVFQVTRIGISILKSIEDNQFERLPPTIYLRNFLKSYAELLQIDPKKMAEGYIKNLARYQKTV